jgi:hypothetical protein
MRPLKQPVYHYTTGAAAAAILDQATLRATNILYLDDGREMQHSVDYFRRAMAARERDHPGRISVEMNQLIEDYLSRVGGTVPPDIWIVTFVAGRDAAGLTRAAEAGGALLAPCCYDDEAKLATMTRGLDVLERLYERRLHHTRGKPDAAGLVRYVVRELALFGALMKQSDMAHEQEWRLILCNPSQTAVGARRIMAHAGPDYTSLYIDIDLADANDRLPVHEVMIGPSRFQQMTERAFRTLLYKHGYEQADVSRSQAPVPATS